jgi:molybdopterin-guanine dinucleotide biosynthesis protein A
MGRDKASLPFCGETLLARVVRTLASVVDEIVVVARRGQALPALPHAGRAQVSVVHDEVEGKGPLGGLLPGLRAATCEAAYASSCDVPFLSTAFVETVFASLGTADVAIPQAGGRLNPLAAVYRRSVLPHVEALLAADRLRPVFLLERVPHVLVPEDALRAADPELLSLSNVNTPEDYAAALRRLP